MRTTRTYTYADSTGLATQLLRLLLTLMLYFGFALLCDTVYAQEDKTTGGTILLNTPEGKSFNALLLQTEVHFDVSGMIARARVSQRFSNNSNYWAEGVYVFPLPDNAAVDHFRLQLNGRILEGQVQERSTARQDYENARRAGKQAGLVEQQRDNVFTSRLANIAPGESVSVEIEYQQTLVYKDGNYRLRFPLVVAPRYAAINHNTRSSNIDTDVTSPVSDMPINPVQLHILLDAGIALDQLYSSNHDIDVRQTDQHRYSISLADQVVPADRDFELVWRPELSAQPYTTIYKQQHDDFEYVMLSVLPPNLDALGQQQMPRDVIFILDVSGSMSGTSIEQARSSLIHALNRLAPEDRFNIIWFNDRSEQLYPRARHATPHNIDIASNVISKLTADGGTVMQSALQLALSRQPETSRLRQIVFLTDGNVDNEAQLFSLISEQLGENRLFTIGIGSAPNSHFMRKAARAGRGSFTYIGNVNEVQEKTGKLLARLESPALVNIDVQIDGAEVEMFPQPLPDLYLGEPVTLLIRGKQLGNTIRLYGDYAESLWQQEVLLQTNVQHPGVRTAWARDKISALMEQHHEASVETERDSIQQQVIDTSVEHHLVSHYTSLVAVDITPANNSGELYTEKLKTNLPHGWKPSPGVQPGRQQFLLAQLSLPQTASNASLHLLIACMLFSVVMILSLWRKLT